MTPRPATSIVVGFALLLAGCESSQDKSARLAKKAAGAEKETGLKITRPSRDVRVMSTTVLEDQYGVAAVVELDNRARSPRVNVPVAITVKDAAGRRLFANDAPGLTPTLTHMPALRKGQRAYWVHDQVVGRGAGSLEATVGEAPDAAPRAVPELEVRDLKPDVDPDGLMLRGQVHNTSKILQRNVIVFAVARRGDKVVAAGRGGIERLPPGKRRKFRLFWIGDPKGARAEAVAPPTVLEEEGR